MFYTNVSGFHFTFFLSIYVCVHIHIYAHAHIGEAAKIFEIQLDNVFLFYHSNLLRCVNIYYWNIWKEKTVMCQNDTCQQNFLIPNIDIRCVVYLRKKRHQKGFFLVLHKLFTYLSLKKMRRNNSTTEERGRFQLNLQPVGDPNCPKGCFVASSRHR